MVICRNRNAATDLAEYLGTVIALNLLFNIPMIYAAIFGALDVILILTVTVKKISFLRATFYILVSIISFGYLYELFIVKPDPLCYCISFFYTFVTE